MHNGTVSQGSVGCGIAPRVAATQGSVGSDTALDGVVPFASFDAPDAVHRFGRFDIRRAQPSDALQFCRADAEMVANAYPGVMPEIWSLERLEEADGLAPERERHFADCLAEEARGGEPDERTWIAFDGETIVGIGASRSRPHSWEATNGSERINGVNQQLSHLYLAPQARGTGLADALLELALPGRMPGYLWIIGGNERGWRFYERHGFVGDGVTYNCGPIWYDQPLYRMYRVS